METPPSSRHRSTPLCDSRKSHCVTSHWLMWLADIVLRRSADFPNTIRFRVMNLPCCLETANWLEWLTHTKSLPNIYQCCLSVIGLMSGARSLTAFVTYGEGDKWSFQKFGLRTQTLYKASRKRRTFGLRGVKRLQGSVVSVSSYVESRPGGVVQFPWIPGREKSMLSWYKLLLLASYSSLRVCVCVSLSTISWPMAYVGCSLSISGLPLLHSRQLSGESVLPAQLYFPQRPEIQENWRKEDATMQANLKYINKYYFQKGRTGRKRFANSPNKQPTQARAVLRQGVGPN